MTNALLTEAIQDCEVALAQPEKWFFSCTMLSNILQDMGQEQLAYLWKNISRQTDLTRQTYHILVGATYIRFEDWDNAILHNKKAIAIDHKLAIAYSNLAKLYARLDAPEARAEYLYKFMALGPGQSDGDSCEELGNTLLEQGQVSQAINCYRWAIQNNSQQWTAYYRIAHLLTCAKQTDHAIRYYKLLLERDPTQAEAHQKLGKLLLNQQCYGEASTHFRAALAQKPDFIWAYLGLAQVALALEQWDETLEMCKHAIQLDDELIWAYRHMANALIAKGSLEGAGDCWQRVAALSGWPECLGRNYRFTRDPFTQKIALWSEQLLAWKSQDDRTEAVQVLQIGARQGMWSCWMLDHMLRHPEDHLLCIDQCLTQSLQQNLTKASCSAAGTVSCQQSEPKQLLEKLNRQGHIGYDLIYIQDRRGDAEIIYQEAMLAWPLLKAGGMMALRDYNSTMPAQGPDRSLKVGIDNFLQNISGEFKILSQAQQLFFMLKL